jgi:maleamate amidohydrolase
MINIRKEHDMAVWDDFLSDQDKEHIAASRPRPRFGFGERPAVLAIDNYRNVVGDEPLPLLESIKLWPSSTGMAGWQALDRVAELFALARGNDIPIVHITGLAEEDSGVAGWSRPRAVDGTVAADPAKADRHARRFDFPEPAAPLPGEAVLRKTAPSAFFGTPLAAHLTALGVDTLIVCGESTSGCVRASVVEARSYRFKVVVVEEAVYDRHQACHAINLFDMNSKYADVLPLAEVAEWMTGYGKAADRIAS